MIELYQACIVCSFPIEVVISIIVVMTVEFVNDLQYYIHKVYNKSY